MCAETVTDNATCEECEECVYCSIGIKSCAESIRSSKESICGHVAVIHTVINFLSLYSCNICRHRPSNKSFCHILHSSAFVANCGTNTGNAIFENIKNRIRVYSKSCIYKFCCGTNISVFVKIAKFILNVVSSLHIIDILAVIFKNAIKHARVKIVKTKNRIKSYCSVFSSIYYSLFKRNIHCNRLCLFSVISCPCKLFSFGLLLVSIDVIYSNGHNAGKHIPNHTVSVIANDRLNETIADSTTKGVFISINHAFNIACFSPVEGSVCIYFILCYLHCGRKCSDVCIDRINNDFHKVAYGDALNLCGFGTEGVHYGNENNFNVGVALEDSIKSTCVVENERYCDIKNNVGKFGRRRVSCESNLYFFYHFYNVSL